MLKKAQKHWKTYQLSFIIRKTDNSQIDTDLNEIVVKAPNYNTSMFVAVVELSKTYPQHSYKIEFVKITELF